MPLNPLDWTAGPFLTLYVCLTGVAYLLLKALRSRAGDRAAGGFPGMLDALHLAWLAGGRERAMHTALLGLCAHGAATPSGAGAMFSTGPAPRALPREFVPYRDAVLASAARSGAVMRAAAAAAGGANAPGPDGWLARLVSKRASDAARGKGDPSAAAGAEPPTVEVTWSMFRQAIDPGLDKIRERLTTYGLLPNEAEASWLARAAWLFLGCPLVLGAAKIVVGASRGRPVGILVVLVVLTLLVAWWMARNPPARTRAGTLALAESRARHARAARAPTDQELPLAFALTGAAVLAGTAYATLVTPPGGTGGGSGGDGGSGCGGGGSDSGGDSGGGGCGGCGGGGSD